MSSALLQILRIPVVTVILTSRKVDIDPVSTQDWAPLPVCVKSVAFLRLLIIPHDSDIVSSIGNYKQAVSPESGLSRHHDTLMQRRASFVTSLIAGPHPRQPRAALPPRPRLAPARPRPAPQRPGSIGLIGGNRPSVGRPQRCRQVHRACAHDCIQYVSPNTGRPLQWLFTDDQGHPIERCTGLRCLGQYGRGLVTDLPVCGDRGEKLA